MDKIVFKKIQTLDEQFYVKLKKECLDLARILNFNNDKNQIILQTLDPNVNDFITGVGKIERLEVQDETEYKHIQPALRGTAIEKLLEELNVFRTRLMLSKARTCYSIHNDPTYRLHMALETNDQAYFLFPKLNKFHQIPEDRSIYYVDTREDHSFANCGVQDRIHLVMCSNNLLDI